MIHPFYIISVETHEKNTRNPGYPIFLQKFGESPRLMQNFSQIGRGTILTPVLLQQNFKKSVRVREYFRLGVFLGVITCQICKKIAE